MSTAVAERPAAAPKSNNGRDIRNEQMAALPIIAYQYGLDPFTKEIYTFPDEGGIVLVVGVDGWSRLMNENPQSDGFGFAESEETLTFEGKTTTGWP